MIISISHQKGGVGKSTISFNLSVEILKDFLEKKDIVKSYDNFYCVDLDYQKSFTIFNTKRKILNKKYNENLPLLNIYTKDNFENEDEFINFLTKNEKDLIIIDTGGYDSVFNRLSLIYSDIIITPISDSKIELYGLEIFKKILDDIKKIDKTKKSYVLLNNVSVNRKNFNEYFEYVKDNNEYFNILNSIVKNRKIYKDSFDYGKNVCELQHFKSCDEIQNLKNEILNISNNLLKEIEK